MKRIKLFLLSAGILLFALYSGAQNLSTTIKTQAIDMANALIKNDFNVYMKYMHPGIIEFAGGKEQMKAKMDSAYLAMKRFGVSFKKYWIDNPGKIVEYKNQLQSVLPVSTILLTALGELHAETSIIVISNDKGKNWWFIDTNVYRADKLKEIMPDLSPELVIPPAKKPQIVPVKSNP
jgi:hypothetical protein